MLRFEFIDHAQLVGVAGDFEFVPLRKFDRMEERVLHALAAQGDLHVVQNVRDGGAFEHRRAFARRFRRRKRALHQLPYALVFERRDLHDGHAERLFEPGGVQLIAVFGDRVDHVERDHDGHVDLHELRGKVQIAFEIGRVDDVDDAIGLFVQDIIAGDDLFRRVRGERIDTGKVDDLDGFVELFVNALALIHRDARPVADVRRAAREGVEQRGLPAVRVAR